MVFLYVLLSVIYIIIVICVGLRFGDIAERKGYNKSTWAAAAIFIGVPVWIMIIALPNNYQYEGLLAELKNLSVLQRAIQDSIKVGNTSISNATNNVQNIQFKQSDKNNIPLANPATLITGQAYPLIRRAYLSLEESNWSKADELLEQALNIEPENASIYVGKLCVELRVTNEEDLKNHASEVAESNNYKRALQFADNHLREKLVEYVFLPEERESNLIAQIGELAYLNIIKRVEAVKASKSASDYKALLADFEQAGYNYNFISEPLREWAMTVKWVPIKWSSKPQVNCPLCNATQASSSTKCINCGIEFDCS